MSSILFPDVFSNVILYNKRMEILLCSVSFCNPKSIINSFLRIQFVSCTHQVEFFLSRYLFQYFGLHLFKCKDKRDVLEPDLVSVVTAHMVYIFACALALEYLFQKNARELGVGRSHAILCRRQWKNIGIFHANFYRVNTRIQVTTFLV